MTKHAATFAVICRSSFLSARHHGACLHHPDLYLYFKLKSQTSYLMSPAPVADTEGISLHAQNTGILCPSSYIVQCPATSRAWHLLSPDMLHLPLGSQRI